MRARIRFTKLGKVRFTSHRDVARLWERALRVTGLPVAQTEGFNPRPRLHFGLALPTSYESVAEYLDVDLREPEAAALDLADVAARLSAALPVGMEVTAIAPLAPGTPALQEAVVRCTWEAEVPGVPPDELTRVVAGLLAAETLVVQRERKGKPVTDDLRPGLEHVRVLGATAPDAPQAGSVLELLLATRPRGIRPGEVLAAATPPLQEGRVRRTRQWIDGVDGAPREPLEAAQDAASAQHAEVRA